MGRQATSELCVTPETKKLCKEAKPEGVTWDYWIRKEALGVE
jgi:hypothetical protein